MLFWCFVNNNCAKAVTGVLSSYQAYNTRAAESKSIQGRLCTSSVGWELCMHAWVSFFFPVPNYEQLFLSEMALAHDFWLYAVFLYITEALRLKPKVDITISYTSLPCNIPHLLLSHHQPSHPLNCDHYPNLNAVPWFHMMKRPNLCPNKWQLQ